MNRVKELGWDAYFFFRILWAYCWDPLFREAAQLNLIGVGKPEEYEFGCQTDFLYMKEDGRWTGGGGSGPLNKEGEYLWGDKWRKSL